MKGDHKRLSKRWKIEMHFSNARYYLVRGQGGEGLSVVTKRFGIQSPDDQRRQRWQIETAADLCSRLAAHGASANQRSLDSLQKSSYR